jgi:hypothetical protein
MFPLKDVIFQTGRCRAARRSGTRGAAASYSRISPCSFLGGFETEIRTPGVCPSKKLTNACCVVLWLHHARYAVLSGNAGRETVGAPSMSMAVTSCEARLGVEKRRIRGSGA